MIARHRFRLRVKRPLLLVKRQQVRQQKHPCLFLVRFVSQVQQFKILPKAVAVKILVAVINENRLAIFLGHLVVSRGGHGLNKGRAIFKGEACLSEGIAEPAPRLAAAALVAFIHEDQIIAFEGLHSHTDAAAAFFFYQLGDFDDPNSVLVSQPQTAILQAEPLATDVRRGHFFHMLFGEAFVWRNKQDVVQRLAVIVQELPEVDMHDQRLAAAGGHPEGQLVQVGLGEYRVGCLAGRAARVTGIYELV